MNTTQSVKRRTKTNQPERWAISLPGYPVEARKKATALAKAHRMSIGAYVAMLLDDAVKDAR